MNILSFDTVANACSVAIFRDGTVHYSDKKILSKGHSEVLIPMIQKAVTLTKMDFNEIDLVAVTVGPGSYTGLRVGLSVARGFGVSLGVPVFGVTSFEAVAEGLPKHEKKKNPILIVFETKREDLYLQIITKGGLVGNPEAVLPGGLRDVIVPYLDTTRDVIIVGDGAQRAYDILKSGNSKIRVQLGSALCGPDATHVAIFSEKKCRGNIPKTLPEPLYIKPPSAKTLNELG